MNPRVTPWRRALSGRWMPCVLAAGCLLGHAPLRALNSDDVRVEHPGSAFSIDVVMHTSAPLEIAWAVLTDFDHMVGVVPDLTRSQVTQRQGQVWTVSQAGVAHWGPFALNFESVRELHLVPLREIRAHTLSGTTKRMDSLMQLMPEAGGTQLTYHAEMEPGGFFPPGLGPAAVRRETAEQFTALLAEMQRRRQPASNVSN